MSAQNSMEEHTFVVEGMTCGHCVAAVRRELEFLEGVTVREVRIGSVTVAYEAAAVDRRTIEAAVEAAGYMLVS